MGLTEAPRVEALEKQVKELQEAHNKNLTEIKKAFMMSDVNIQVLQRVARDLSAARTADDGKGALKIVDGTLDLDSYYTEWQQVVKTAGEDHADIAAVYWSRGASMEESIARAKSALNQDAPAPKAAEAPDERYEVQEFGGDYGQNHDESHAQAAQANG